MAGRIREESIAEVREKAPIDEIVSQYVTLKNAGGGSMKGLCPFHDEKTPSFNGDGTPAADVALGRRCVEAQIMDLADDVAYSVHDVEDGVVAERLDLAQLDRPAVWAAVRDWYLPEAADDELDAALAGLAQVDSWPEAPYDGSRRSLAALKNLTSDLIGRFCGTVQEATFAAAPGPFVRYRADLVVPEAATVEMAVLKGIAAHYVMQADDRVALMMRQRELVSELVEALLAHAPASLDPDIRRGLGGRSRRRDAAAGGHRPGRLPHGRQRGDVARSPRAAGQRRAGRARLGWRA